MSALALWLVLSACLRSTPPVVVGSQGTGTSKIAGIKMGAIIIVFSLCPLKTPPVLPTSGAAGALPRPTTALDKPQPRSSSAAADATEHCPGAPPDERRSRRSPKFASTSAGTSETRRQQADRRTTYCGRIGTRFIIPDLVVTSVRATALLHSHFGH